MKDNSTLEPIRLTQYSHGAGCGCKISPKLLDEILHSGFPQFQDPNLLVGNETKDDAAVYDIGNGTAIVSTTDFFMPIVDDPFDFGRIAATNAISDVYAMGGKPIMAIAILGWPISVLPAEIARQVIDGGRAACKEAGITLAGGHSIDAPEPIFGLAVTGIVPTHQVKRNASAQSQDRLYLTKPLGIGILTTAEKKGLLQEQHQGLATRTMCILNKPGAAFAELPGVHAITDVTGFGLLGHLGEICQGSGVQAQISYGNIPVLDGVHGYIEQGCVPGGTQRNFDSYGHQVSTIDERQKALFCDPQTSGGLLVAVSPDSEQAFLELATKLETTVYPIGHLLPGQDSPVLITVKP